MDYKTEYIKYKLKYLQTKCKMEGGFAALIDQAWKLMIKAAQTASEKHQTNLDGLAFWNVIKPFLSEIDSRAHDEIVWNPEHQQIVTEFREIEERIPEKDEEGELIEKNHFLLQQVNIPTKDKQIPSFRRLIQIGLNIGFFMRHQIKFDEDILKMREDFNMNNIETYMTRENYNKFKFEIDDLKEFKKMLKELVANPPLRT